LDRHGETGLPDLESIEVAELNFQSIHFLRHGNSLTPFIGHQAQELEFFLEIPMAPEKKVELSDSRDILTT